jgi:two-component system nitrogen regulation sensor histidine kinase NtrY
LKQYRTLKKGNLDINIRETGSYEMQIVMQSLNEIAPKIFSQHKQLTNMNNAQRTMIVSLKLSTGMLLIDANVRIIISNLATSKILELLNLLESNVLKAFPETDQILKRYCNLLDEMKITPLAKNELSYSDWDSEYNVEIFRNNRKRICKVNFMEFNIVSTEEDNHVQMNESQNDFCILMTFDGSIEIIAVQQLRVREDIARKVAHEVRNPLLPIQLSIERLGKKFLS